MGASAGQADQAIALKWWRWDVYVGQWMPSEPPEGDIDDAQWCRSASRPLHTVGWNRRPLDR